MTGTAKKDGHPAPNTNDDCDTHNNRESKSSFYKVSLNDGTEKEDEREPCPGVLDTVAPKLQSGDGALSTLSPSEGLAVAAATADATMLTTKAVEVFLEDIGPAKEAEEKQPTTKEVTGVAANAVDAKTSEGTEMQRVVIPGFFEAASLAEKAKGEHLAEEEVATAAATAVATKATKMAITAVPVEAEAAMHPVEGTGEGQMMAEEAAAIATDTAKAQVAEHEEIHDASFLCCLCLTKDAKVEHVAEEGVATAEATNIASGAMKDVHVAAIEESETSAGLVEAVKFPTRDPKGKQPMAEEAPETIADAAKAKEVEDTQTQNVVILGSFEVASCGKETKKEHLMKEDQAASIGLVKDDKDE